MSDTRPRCSHFRCPKCMQEVVLPEAVCRAPVCGDCERYMAPVNAKRGQA